MSGGCAVGVLMGSPAISPGEGSAPLCRRTRAAASESRLSFPAVSIAAGPVRRPGGRAEKAARLSPDGGAMVYTLAYQIYKYEHGVTAGAQRAADERADEAAAALRDLSLRLRRA